MPQAFTIRALENGGSRNLAVDGSVTPVVFDLDLTGLDAITIFDYEIYIESLGNPIDPKAFFTLGAALPVGFKFEGSTQGTTFENELIQTTRDLLFSFSTGQEFRKRNTNNSIGNYNIFQGGRIVNNNGLVLSSRTSDYLRVTINDDLTGIDYMAISLQGTFF